MKPSSDRALERREAGSRSKSGSRGSRTTGPVLVRTEAAHLFTPVRELDRCKSSD